MTKRVEQLSELIHEKVAQILLKVTELPDATLITVTKVKVTPDVHLAQVSVSIFPPDVAEAVFSLLQTQRKMIQQLLAEQLSIKHSPKIRFTRDMTLDRVEEIDILLKKNQE